MVLNRYILREAAAAWLAVTLVLLAVMVSTRFASVLNFAVKGDVPRDLLAQVAMLSSLRYLVILVPASLLLAIMLSLGRLYSDNEVTAMMGCGVSLTRLYRPFFLLAALLAAMTAALSFNIGPWAGREADYVVKDAKRLLQYSPFTPGHFNMFSSGRTVVYTSSVSKDGKQLGEVFAQMPQRTGRSIVVARSGTQAIDPTTGSRSVILHDGYRYTGALNEGYDVFHFDSMKIEVAPPPFVYINSQHALARTEDLLASSDPLDQAELQTRIAAPISVLMLALLAVPLSHVRPRQGRYSRIVYGIFAYLLYANLLTVGATWIAKGRLSASWGLWGIHALVGVIAFSLIARRQGWFRR